ncbi:unnamed protein product [Phaeothamnion confervicola]
MVQLRALIGEPFGSVFEMDRNRLRKVTGDLTVEPDADAGTSGPIRGRNFPSASCGADNRSFVDSNTAQRLDHHDIERMKQDGDSGQAIIAALVANSDTWASKTQFSRAKWLKKKQQKYLPRLRVVRPAAAAVCDAYAEKHSAKVGSLRTDSLALLLSYADVKAGGRLLVFDELMGVVAASAAERMDLRGRILALYAGPHPSHDAATRFNFPELDLLRFFVDVPTALIGPATNARAAAAAAGAAASAATGISAAVEEYRLVLVAKGGIAPNEMEKLLEKRRQRLRRLRARPTRDDAARWLAEGSDSLIIACKHDPSTVLEALLPLLQPSAAFAIFSDFIEPLIDCFQRARKWPVVGLQLSDTWYREFQVLPGRTHPHMNMSATGGYILCGYKVDGSGTDGAPPMVSLPLDHAGSGPAGCQLESGCAKRPRRKDCAKAAAAAGPPPRAEAGVGVDSAAAFPDPAEPSVIALALSNGTAK